MISQKNNRAGKLSAGWVVVGCVVFVLMCLTRLSDLGGRVYQHDESMFATFGWEWSHTGNYQAQISAFENGPTHHALLHGPLQMQVIGLTLWLGRMLGLPENAGDWLARLPAALCAIALLLPIWGLRHWLGGSRAAILAMGLVLVSPGLWYYGRFCRNESLFLLASLFALWSVARVCSASQSKMPRRIVMLFPALALPFCIKENALFLAFDAVTFLMLLGTFNLFYTKRGTAFGQQSAGWFSLQWRGRNAWAMLAGVSLSMLLLELVYSNFLRWDTHFWSMMTDAFVYWKGQHVEHRLYGDFTYHLGLLLTYQPYCLLVLLIAACWHVQRNRPVSALLIFLFYNFAVFILGTYVGTFADFLVVKIPFISGWVGEAGVLGLLHMTRAWHFGLACLVGWLTIRFALQSIRTGSRFRAALIWWTGLSFLQYSYAGEKVPWLSVHIVLPLLLLTAHLLAAFFNEHSPGFRKWRKGVYVIVFLVGGLQAYSGYRLCFVQPTFPGETMVYNHTQPAMKLLADQLRRENAAGRSVLIHGEISWPLLWYLRGTSVLFSEGKDERMPVLDGIDWLVLAEGFVPSAVEFPMAFASPRAVALRQAWIVEGLHPLVAWRWPGSRDSWWNDRFPDGETRMREVGLWIEPEQDPEFYKEMQTDFGLGAMGKAWRFWALREPWNVPRTLSSESVVVYRRVSSDDE